MTNSITVNNEHDVALAFYPPLQIESVDGFDWFVCAAGHHWGGRSDECPTCRRNHEFRLKGRPSCIRFPCTNVVGCSQRTFDAGERRCQEHYREDARNTWNAGPITLDIGPTVFGQYHADTWNGWLMPSIDAWSVQHLIEQFEDGLVSWETNEDGHGTGVLVVKYDDEDEQPERLEPDEDGFYGLGAGSWTWSEDHEFFDTTEHQEWTRERGDVWAAANNACNQSLIEAGVADRRALNLQAAEIAVAVWRDDNPEPANVPDYSRIPGAKKEQA